MEQIRRELIEGIQGLVDLLTTVSDTIPTDQAKEIARCGGYGFGGYTFYIGRTSCFVGINYSTPGVLQFVAHDIQKDNEGGLGAGTIHTGDQGFDWKNEFDLASAQDDFFALSIAAQRAVIEKFLRNSIDIVSRLLADAHAEPYDGGLLCI